MNRRIDTPAVAPLPKRLLRAEGSRAVLRIGAGSRPSRALPPRGSVRPGAGGLLRPVRQFFLSFGRLGSFP